MRKVINISVPEQVYKSVSQAVKKGGFASKSEYIRHLLREKEEDDVVAEIRKRQKEVREGNVKELRSLKDLA